MSKSSPLIVLSLSASLLMLGVGMTVALLPQRVHAMTGTLESVGLVASVFALTYLLAQLPIGVLSDRLGPKRFLVIGYLLCSVSGIVFFTAETAGGIYLGRAIQGVGEAPIWALGPAVLSLAYPAARGRAIGIYNAAIHIGLTLGPLLGLLISPGGQGRLPFLCFTGLCLAAGVLVLLFLRQAPGTVRHARPTVRQYLAVLQRRSAATLLFGVLLYGAGYGAFLSVLPASLVVSHGFGPAAVGMFFVLFYAAVSLSQIVVGVLSDRIGRHGFLVWGMSLAAAGVASFPAVPGDWAYLPLGGASVGLGMFCVASIADLSESVPDPLKGVISGSYYVFWGAGYVLGPLAIGAVGTGAPFIGYGALAFLFGLQSLAMHMLLK
ncbi:MFS transporter [Acuticoccus mangrovi]|uniref:MFS transporter n=1 Tax=Acuticoccus mangrovi TaxID=2796142 RepID=A0A934IKA8_9HYPH|nr:MFS transporter [Acuticoccus mangrovi]MBJ3776551.1 MFS transporter [Acuticoccus mangrovi]